MCSYNLRFMSSLCLDKLKDKNITRGLKLNKNLSEFLKYNGFKNSK